jgi:predicted dehydrogenase
MTPLRLGIIGCGAITQEVHLPIVLNRSDIKISILCDKILATAERAKRLFGLPTPITNDLDAVVTSADIALVAVPPRLHKSVCCSLLEKGLDVLCEKPLAANPDEAREIAAVVERAGRLLGVGFQTRFLGGNALMSAVIQEGMLGELQEVKCEFGAKMDYPMSGDAYYNFATTRGGVLYDSGIHIVDRVIALFGPIDVLRFEDDSFGGVESNAYLAGSVSVFGRSVPCSMWFSWTHPLPNTICAIGTRATAMLGRSWPESVLIKSHVTGLPTESMLNWSGALANSDDKGGGHRLWADFVDAVRTRRPPLNDVNSSIRVLETIERAYSIRTPMQQPWVIA